MVLSIVLYIDTVINYILIGSGIWGQGKVLDKYLANESPNRNCWVSLGILHYLFSWTCDPKPHIRDSLHQLKIPLSIRKWGKRLSEMLPTLLPYLFGT